MDLAAIRKLAGLSQEQLAERMGTKQTVVSRLERQQDWKLSTVAAYLTACGVDCRMVISRGGEKITLELSKKTGTFIVQK